MKKAGTFLIIYSEIKAYSFRCRYNPLQCDSKPLTGSVRLICSLACIVCFFIQPANSQNLQDTIVLDMFEYHEQRNQAVPGTKNEQIDQKTLRQYESRNLSGLLAGKSPVYIKDYGPGSIATPSFRGTGAAHTKVEWNGIPLNSPLTGLNDFNLIPVNMMDGIGITHGAGGISARPGGLGGMIHLRNHPNWKQNNRYSITQHWGSFHRHQTTAGIDFGGKRLQSETKLYYKDHENDYKYRDLTMPGKPVHEQDHAAVNQYGVMQELYYRPDSNDLVSLHGWFQQSKREIPPPMNVANQAQNQKDRQIRIAGKWLHFGEGYKFRLNSGLIDHKLRFRDRLVGIDAVHHSHGILNEFCFTRKFNHRSSLDAGLTYDYHWANSDGFSGMKDQNRVSAYTTYRRTWSELLAVKLRLQQELVDESFAPLIPTLGFTLTPFAANRLALKGSIYRNYKLPSLNDLYWANGGNPDLKPEHGRGKEIGLDFSKPVKQITYLTKIHADATAYHGVYDNWIQWTPNATGTWEARNIKQVLTQGIESSAGTKWQFGKLKVSLSVTYAYTQSKNLKSSSGLDASEGKQLIYVPFHQGSVSVSVRYAGYRLSYLHRHTGKRFVTRDHYKYLNGYDVASTGLGKTFQLNGIRLRSRISVRNLFDETYQELAWRPMPGRSFHLMIGFKFGE